MARQCMSLAVTKQIKARWPRYATQPARTSMVETLSMGFRNGALAKPSFDAAPKKTKNPERRPYN